MRVLTPVHFICNNCTTHSSNTVAWIALIVSGCVLVVNVILAGATWKSAGATEKAAEATKDSAGATAWAAKETAREAQANVDLVNLGQRQLERNYLPVIVPFANRVVIDNVAGHSAAILKIQIENVGVGPAIGLRMDYLFNEVIPPDPERRQAYLPALAAGANSAMALVFNGFTWGGNDCQVTIAFRDVFQNHYKMACHFAGGDRLETTDVVLDALTPTGGRIERIIGDGG